MRVLLARSVLAVALSFVFLPPSTSFAQVENKAADRMRQLDFLTGEWEGTGWIVMGPSGRHEFRQREVVRGVAGGTVLVIEGLGVSTEAGGGEEAVHQAFAVISLDMERDRFRMRAYRADGGEVDVEPTIGYGKLVWGFRDPRGPEIRFTVEVKGDTWHEIGEVSMDEGATWMQFFEMTLRRTGAR